MSARWRKEVWWWERSSERDHYNPWDPRVYSLMEGGGDWDDLNELRAVVSRNSSRDDWEVAIVNDPTDADGLASPGIDGGCYPSLKAAKAATVARWRKGVKVGSRKVKMGRGRLKTKPKWADDYE
tara:strand:- start:418 stop:792 length:375 start_codon:yes stop_codon:yes gene_type:complete